MSKSQVDKYAKTICVLKHTNEKIDLALYNSNLHEFISLQTFRNREKICVIKGTDIKAADSNEKNVEHISLAAFRDRKKVCVLKGTNKKVNPDQYTDDAVEYITNAVWKKRKTVSVSKITGKTISSPKNKDDLITISRNKYNHDKKVWVLKGTAVEIEDPSSHPSKEIEEITKNTLCSRKKVAVLRGTTTVVSSSDINESEIEYLTKSQLSKRKINFKKRSLTPDDERPVKRSKLIHPAKDYLKPTLIKEEPTSATAQDKSTIHPIMELNLEELDQVVKVLRGENNASENCTHLVQKLIDYFQTGIIPKESAPTEFEQQHFGVQVSYTPVFFSSDFKLKIETLDDTCPFGKNTRQINMVSSSYINRNTLFGAYAPPGLSYYEDDNYLVDLTKSLIDVDLYQQQEAHYLELTETLKNEAKTSNAGRSFGIVCLARCGQYAHLSGHILMYFAKADKVTYIECQHLNGEKKTGRYIYHELTDMFRFAGSRDNKITINTFGPKVFHTPLSHPNYNHNGPELKIVL